MLRWKNFTDASSKKKIRKRSDVNSNMSNGKKKKR